MKWILALALLFGGYAQAATTHFCNCTGVGAEGDCVNGADGNAGTAASPKQTLSAFTTAWNAAVAGDQLLLCKGGAWDTFHVSTEPRNSTIAQYAANPLVVGSYSPTTFTGTAKPRLNPTLNRGSLSITAITKAVCARVTVANTLVAGDAIHFGTISGMPEIAAMWGTVKAGADATCPAAAAPTTSVVYVTIDTSQFTNAGTTGDAVISCEYSAASTCNIFNFHTGNATAYGGYTFQDLEVHGADNYGTGFLNMYNNGQNILIQRMTISHVDGAIGCSNGASPRIPSPRNITVRANTISYTLAMGVVSFGCNNLLVENNTFDYTANGVKAHDGKIRDHAMYISGQEQAIADDPLDSTGIVIRGNTITNTCLNHQKDTTWTTATPTKCRCGQIVGHARVRNWIVENNTFKQEVGTSTAFCYGMDWRPANGPTLPEFFRFFTLRGNRIINPGNLGILTAACQDCTIENNVVVQGNVWDTFTGIGVEQAVYGISPYENNQRVNIRNNSVFIQQATDVSQGIQLNGSGTGHNMVGNLVMYGSGGPGGNGACFLTDRTSAAFTTWDNNLCYNFAGWTAAYATKAAFTSGFGASADANGVSADPVLVTTPTYATNGRMQIQTTSPAKNAGHASKSSRLAIDGYPKVGVRDIGAFEFGSNP